MPPPSPVMVPMFVICLLKSSVGVPVTVPRLRLADSRLGRGGSTGRGAGLRDLRFPCNTYSQYSDVVNTETISATGEVELTFNPSFYPSRVRMPMARACG